MFGLLFRGHGVVVVIAVVATWC